MCDCIERIKGQVHGYMKQDSKFKDKDFKVYCSNLMLNSEGEKTYSEFVGVAQTVTKTGKHST